MEDLDKDHDGSLSLEEYLGDPGVDPDTGEMPEWVKSETETFKNVRDKNGDEKMDKVGRLYNTQMHGCIHAHVHTHTHTHTHTRSHTCTHMHMRTRTCARAHTHLLCCFYMLPVCLCTGRDQRMDYARQQFSRRR